MPQTSPMDQRYPHYFNNTSFLTKGSQVEVSSDEDGFNGAWFVATVIHPPPSISTTKKNHHTRNNLVYVEYHNLLSEDGSSRRLREYANVSYVRPSPHPETNAAAPHFQLNDLVDAFYRDGWWTGVITSVVDSSNFLVTFQNPPDQIQFNSSDLRVHRRWDGGRWVQPEIQRTAGLMFTVSKKVEVCFEGENLRDVWFPATVLQNLGNNSFLVEYQQPGISDEATLHKVTVDYLHIRPSPPHLRDKNFVLLEKVDAYYDFGWWSGVITKELAGNRYNVFFKHTKKEREFDCSRVRPHMEWKGGKWFTTSQGETDGRTTHSKQMEQTTPIIGKQSTVATSIAKRTKQTDLDSTDKNSLSSRRLECETRSDDLSLSSKNTNGVPVGKSEGFDSERSKQGKSVELKTPTMNSSRKKGKLETELRSEGAKDDPVITRSQEKEVAKDVIVGFQCNGMTVSQEKKPEQLSSTGVAEGETNEPCVGLASLTVVDKEGKEKEGEAETIAPTPKRKRGRPPKMQALSPETPVAAAVNHENEGVAVSEMEGAEMSASSGTKPLELDAHKPENTSMESGNKKNEDLNVQVQAKAKAQAQEGKKYSSMKGKRGKRRTISLNTTESPTEADSREKADNNSPTRNAVVVSEDQGGWLVQEGELEMGFGDKLPFKISTPTLWKTIESMEAFRKIPQRPHFQPLEGTKESGREGLAIGSMVTFSTVVEKTCALRFDDPRSAIEECLETLAELETHGFEVELIRDRLTQLLLMKDKQEELQQHSKGVTDRLEERRMEGRIMDSEIGEIDKEMMELEETRRQLLSHKERHHSGMGATKAAGELIHHHLTEVGLQFHGLAAAPFLTKPNPNPNPNPSLV